MTVVAGMSAGSRGWPPQPEKWLMATKETQKGGEVEVEGGGCLSLLVNCGGGMENVGSAAF